MNAITQGDANTLMLASASAQLTGIETQVSRAILTALKSHNPARDAAACDRIFGIFTHDYLLPCISTGFASRVAGYAGEALVPTVLELEAGLATQFHKGALFHDTAIAYLVSGDEDRYEYFLAMVDQENFHTRGGAYRRGTLNLRADNLTRHTIEERMRRACDLLNGNTAGHAATFAFLTGRAPLTAAALEAWRQRLDSLHQFELLRIIHDVEVFLGAGLPQYPAVADNPFVLLRLAKALSHLAQWVESCLTRWQGSAIIGPLSSKLEKDLDFGAPLCTKAGGVNRFCRSNPHGAAVDSDLRRLLTDVATAPAGEDRYWRLLRVLYIVRNATAHAIEPSLALYQDRPLLLNLLQAAFASVFVLCSLKSKPMP